MEATTTFETETKLIALDDKRCVVGRPQKNVTCTVINSCLRYKGVNLPTFVGTSNFIKEIWYSKGIYIVFFLDIDVSWVLDARKYRSPRMFFLAEEGRNIRNTTMRLFRGKSECRTEQVYLSVSVATYLILSFSTI